MSLSRILRGTFFTAIAAALITGMTASAFATELTFNKWVDEVKISGDYRVRYEYFNRPVASETDRKRFRFRLRLKSDPTPTIRPAAPNTLWNFQSHEH